MREPAGTHDKHGTLQVAALTSIRKPKNRNGHLVGGRFCFWVLGSESGTRTHDLRIMSQYFITDKTKQIIDKLTHV